MAAALSVAVTMVGAFFTVRFAAVSMSPSDGSTFLVLFAAETTVALISKVGSDRVGASLLKADIDHYSAVVTYSRRIHFRLGFPMASVVYIGVLLVSGSKAGLAPAAAMGLVGVLEGRCTAVSDLARSAGHPWKSLAYSVSSRSFTVGALAFGAASAELTLARACWSMLAGALLAWVLIEATGPRAASVPGLVSEAAWAKRGIAVSGAALLFAMGVSLAFAISVRGASPGDVVGLAVLMRLYVLSLVPAMIVDMVVSPYVAQLGPDFLAADAYGRLRRWTVAAAASMIVAVVVGHGLVADFVTAWTDGAFAPSLGPLVLLSLGGGCAVLAATRGVAVSLFGGPRLQLASAAFALVASVAVSVALQAWPLYAVPASLCLAIVVRSAYWYLFRARLEVPHLSVGTSS